MVFVMWGFEPEDFMYFIMIQAHMCCVRGFDFHERDTVCKKRAEAHGAPPSRPSLSAHTLLLHPSPSVASSSS